MKQGITTYQLQMEGLLVDMRELVSEESDGELHDTLRKHKQSCEEAFRLATSAVDDKVAEWKVILEAEETMVETLRDTHVSLAKAVTNFIRNSEDVKACRDCTKDFRSFRDATKKAMTDKAREDAKGAARKNKNDETEKTSATPLGNALLDYLLKSRDKPAADGQNINVKWSPGPDALEPDQPHAVVIPAERTGSLATDLTSMDYFASQKAWVTEVMRDKQLQYCSAHVVRPQVLRLMRRHLSKMPKEIQPSLPAMRDDVLNEIASPQFYQHVPKGSHVTTSTEYGLVEIKVALLGEMQIFGIPWATLAGNSISEKHATLSGMTADMMMQIVLADGFFYDLKPKAAIVVPSTFAIATVVKGDETAHGVRYLIVPTELPKRLEDALNYLELIDASLGEHNHYKKVEEFLRNTRQAKADVA